MYPSEPKRGERKFASYAGIKCYYNGLGWESQHGNATTFEALMKVIDEHYWGQGQQRVSKLNPHYWYEVYGTASKNGVMSTDMYVIWDNASPSVEDKEDLVFLTPDPEGDLEERGVT